MYKLSVKIRTSSPKTMFTEKRHLLCQAIGPRVTCLNK